jgi:tRNA U54 and U55 pseudouridine synthase Pus10
MNNELKRWIENSQQLETLKNAQYELEQKIKQDFLKSHTRIFSLPHETTLNWRQPHIAITIDHKTNQPVVEVREIEYRGILNGKNSKTYPQGTTFIVLKSWKTGKNTKGTHYLLYDKKSKCVANFYG